MGAEFLETLRAASPDWVSGEVLRRPEGISRTAVSKRIRVLRERGYRIESSPRKGYRLVDEPSDLHPADVEERLRGRDLFRHPFVLKRETGSTNDDLRVLAERGAPEGTVVFSEVQRAGRGRRGRDWFGRPGECLQYSILLRPPLSPGEGTLIPLLAATAVYRGLRGMGISGVGIKWPNDVLIAGRKVCGILCEMSVSMEGIEYALLGTGLNVLTPEEAFPNAFREGAGSVASATGRSWSRLDLWVAILREVDFLVQALWAGDRALIREAWMEGAVTPGNRVVVYPSTGEPVVGRAEGITEDGALVVNLPDGGRRVFHSGEVSLRSGEGGSTNSPPPAVGRGGC